MDGEALFRDRAHDLVWSSWSACPVIAGQTFDPDAIADGGPATYSPPSAPTLFTPHDVRGAGGSDGVGYLSMAWVEADRVQALQGRNAPELVELETWVYIYTPAAQDTSTAEQYQQDLRTLLFGWEFYDSSTAVSAVIHTNPTRYELDDDDGWHVHAVRMVHDVKIPAA